MNVVPKSRPEWKHASRRGRGVAVVAAAVVAAVGCLAAANPASARPLDRGHFHDVIDDVITDFCGVSGLTVALTGTVDGSYLDNSHGSDGLVYSRESARADVVYTNVDGGAWVRVVTTGTGRDLHVTDNGDGTLTLTTFGTGNGVMYDSDGNVIARDPGQTRVQILLDDNGTPTDPSDDEFLDFLGVVLGSTGVSDDFCAAQLEAYGVQP
jgi:hypothetical protein